MRASPAISIAILLGVAAVTISTAPVSPHNSAPAPKHRHAAKAPGGPVGQVINAGIWRTDHGFVSTMHIKNVLVTAPVTVKPILFADDGTEFDLPAITIPAAGIASVNVNDSLKELPPQLRGHFQQMGSAAMQWTALSASSVSASMQVLDTSASLNYIFPFSPWMIAADSAQHRLEGLWWKHDENVEGHLALTNVGTATIRASVQAIGSSGSKGAIRTLSLGAHSVTTIHLDELTAEISPRERDRGGLTVTYTSNAEQVIASGWLENPAEGYSAKIPFAHSTGMSMPAQRQTAASVGVMYGDQMGMMGFPMGTTFIPYTEIRNTSGQAVTVAATVLPGNGGKESEKALGQITIGPFASAPFDVANAAKHALGDYSGTINLTFSYTASPGDVLIAAGAVDQTGNYVFEVPPEQSGTNRGKRANYWSVANGYDSMITAWNPSAASETLNLTLWYSNDSAQTQSYILPVPLGPRSAANLSVMEIIMSQKPDRNGHIIPRTVTEGSLEIDNEHSRIDLVASVGVFNATEGTCGSDCVNCNAVVDLELDPSDITLKATDSGVEIQGIVTYEDGREDYTDQLYWDGGDSTIATVDNATNEAAPVNPGSTTWTAEFEGPGDNGGQCNFDDDGGGDCGSAYAYADLTITVLPVITSVSRVQLTSLGTSVLITGKGFGTSPYVNLPGGVSASNQTSSDTQISLTLTMDATATCGAASLNVRNLDVSFATDLFSFTIYCPTSVTLNGTSTITLDSQFPALKTGVGKVTYMQSNPTSTDWDGALITESVSQVSNSCPATSQPICNGSSTFVVGGSGHTGLPNDQFITAQPNIFGDKHFSISTTGSFLGPNDPNSCQAVCSQQYTCGGSAIGNFTITFTYNKDTIQGTPVTRVDVQKQ